MRHPPLERLAWIVVLVAASAAGACSTSSGGSSLDGEDPDGGQPDSGAPFELRWPPAQASLERPRTLGAQADLEALRSKLDAEPYRSWMQRMARRVSDLPRCPKSK